MQSAVLLFQPSEERGVALLGLHRLTNPLLAMFAGVDGYEAVTVPSGTVIELTAKKFNGERLMEVLWDDRKILMFTEELKNATVPI
jgi:hypothetical protein